jgi:hypothetical protein
MSPDAASSLNAFHAWKTSMENIPDELIHHLCSKLDISRCVIIGSPEFYADFCRLVPIHIKPFFILQESWVKETSTTSDYVSPGYADSQVASLDAKINACLRDEDAEKALLIAEADIYLSEPIPVALAEQIRTRLQHHPFCISIGCSANVDYTGALGRLVAGGSKPILQGFTNVTNSEQGSIGAWLELLGSHLTPDRHQQQQLSVAAIIIAYNEGDILEACLTHLHSQGIDIYLIDDESDDATEEIAMRLLSQGILTDYQRSGLATDCEERWSELLALSAHKARSIPADWIIHHDADELRESPWEGISMAEAISMVDRLGYNCIDHTVIEFLFSEENGDQTGNGAPSSGFRRLSRFRFPSHAANFVQLKAWRKADWQAMTAGGHAVQLAHQAVFPLKFLIKHYPLRSLEQARSKVLIQRPRRLTREQEIKGWHIHYNSYQQFQDIQPWTRSELHLFNARTFYPEFLIERLTGCGLDQSHSIDLNTLTARKVIAEQEHFRARIAQTLGLDLTSAAVTSHQQPGSSLWSTQTMVLEQAVQSMVTSRAQALEENDRLNLELSRCNEQLAEANSTSARTSELLAKTKARLKRTSDKLLWNRATLRETQAVLERWAETAQSYRSLLMRMSSVIARLVVERPLTASPFSLPYAQEIHKRWPGR